MSKPTFLLLISILIQYSVFSQSSSLLGNAQSDEYAMGIAADGNGNIYLGATTDSKGWLIKRDPQNNIIWSKILDVSPQFGSDIVYVGIVGDTVFGSGLIKNGTTVLGGFYFKANALTGQTYWVKAEQDSRFYISSMKYAHGKYFLTGSKTGDVFTYDGKVWAVSSADGSIIWQTTPFGIGFPEYDNEYIDDMSSTTEMVNGKMYIIGRSYVNGAPPNMRPILIGIDESGNFFLKKYLLYNVATTPGTNRLYGSGINYDGDSLIVSIFGDDNCSSCEDFEIGLVKTDLQGNVGWAKTYQANEVSTAFSHGVNVTQNGYLLHGYADWNAGNSKFFLIKTDKTGNYQDARLVGLPNGETGTINGALNLAGCSNFVNGKHYLAGGYYLNDPSAKDIVQLVLDENLNDPTPCFSNTSVQVTTVQHVPFSGMLNIIPDVGSVPFANASASSDYNFSSPCNGNVTFTQEGGSCEGDPVSILASSTGFINPTYTWSNGTTGPIILTESANPLTVTVTNAVSCCLISGTVVPVLGTGGDAEIIGTFPNVITPNDDGINDVLDSDYLLSTCTPFELTILNRWGTVIYEQRNGEIPFSGKDQHGNKLSAGVYFYKLSYGKQEKTGFISLVF